METRYAIETAMRNAEKVIAEVHDAFAEKFNRAYGNGLIESYNLEKAENVIIAMGSICGTIKDMIDLKKKEGVEIGLLKIRCYRPLPVEMIKDALKNAKNVAILDKSISLGMNKGAIYADVASHLKDKKTVNYIVGLGGRDITPEDILGIYDDVEISEDGKTNWIGLKEE
jgi:pyruvate ferredoxin oxidoreductase alpha subunit